jgi:hypothetical protein
MSSRPPIPSPDGPDLSKQEFHSLREVSFRKRISPEMERRLTELGLIRQATGGLMLTDGGQIRLAYGK